MPVNWRHGADMIIAGSVSDAEAREAYPDGRRARCLRGVLQPR